MQVEYIIPNIPKGTPNKKEQMQIWARTYFSDNLRKLGFVSWRGEDLSWYKLVNNEVLLTVYLFNFSPNRLLFPSLGYGMHAPFVRPYMPQKLTLRDYDNSETMTEMMFDTPMRPMSDEVDVMITATPDGGYRKFEETIWPMMSRIQTLDDAYQPFRKKYVELHRKRIQKNPDVEWPFATLDFLDEAIFLNDTEMIEHCAIDLKLCYNNSYFRKERPRIEKQMEAVYYGKRNEYLLYLEERKRKILKKLHSEANLIST